MALPVHLQRFGRLIDALVDEALREIVRDGTTTAAAVVVEERPTINQSKSRSPQPKTPRNKVVPACPDNGA